jgi:hypothetical protein
MSDKNKIFKSTNMDKKKKKLDMKSETLKYKNNYYKKKLDQQDRRIRQLQSQVQKLEPIEDKRLSDLILNMQRHVSEFINYVKETKDPMKIINWTLKGERPLYLGLFGIIVFSIYLILKQALDKSKTD